MARLLQKMHFILHLLLLRLSVRFKVKVWRHFISELPQNVHHLI